MKPLEYGTSNEFNIPVCQLMSVFEHAVVSRDKGMLFGETFAAMRTAIASASVIEDNCLPGISLISCLR